MAISYASGRRLVRRSLALAALVGCPVFAGAQPPRAGGAPAGGAAGAPARTPADARHAWQVVAPDAALAWFALLADLRLEGPGALPYVAPSPRPQPALGRRLAGRREYEVLHFGPLYHPSGDRRALAAALRAAATDRDPPPTPRAALLVGALRQSVRGAQARQPLAALADALEEQPAAIPDAASLGRWQAALSGTYLPALAGWLAAERLDAGRLIVSSALGPEGRIFAGTAARDDNLVAVGTFPSDPDPDAPLHAFVRELCFPAVTRAGGEALRTAPDGARRASLAAVRCGAALLDAALPTHAIAYRVFWRRRAAHPDAPFDVSFPRDPSLDPALEAVVRRVVPPRR